MFVIDGHCDTIQVALDKKLDLLDEELMFNLQDVVELVPMIQMMAAFVNPSYLNSFQRACNIIEYFEKQIKKHDMELMQVKNASDIEIVKKQGKIGCLLTIENGRAIEDKIENVDYFYNKGVRVMSINWNEDNLLGCGAKTIQDNGLTQLGKQYIRKLNKNKIIVDISHSSENTFWDTVKISNRPIVATHSCCYSLRQHPRNLKDEQIKAIAKMHGIIGVCYCTDFLSKTGIASTKTIVEHIAYIANLVGIDYVGLGSDFDGLEKEHIPIDLNGIKQIDNLVTALENAGFTKNEIEKIMGENWRRILEKEL